MTKIFSSPLSKGTKTFFIYDLYCLASFTPLKLVTTKSPVNSYLTTTLPLWITIIMG